MKLLSQLTILAVMVITLNACSNDFLDGGETENVFPIGESSIYISPEWGEKEYWFSFPVSQSSEFIIEETPDWLQIENMTGNLTFTSTQWLEPVGRSRGTIRAKATHNPDFAKVGIYLDYMVVKTSNTRYRIPASYISEGLPEVQVNTTHAINYSSTSSLSLRIANTGEGVLIWDVVSMPEWLKVDTANLAINRVVVPRYSHYNIPLKFNHNADVSSNDYVGDIVLSTNDKENPLVTVHVTADLGNPMFNMSTEYKSKIDFSTNLTNIYFSIYNHGYGLLSWRFVDLPEWLSIFTTSGTLYSYNSYQLTVKCDRSMLEPGQNSATIKLKTNDPNNREISILVTATAN